MLSAALFLAGGCSGQSADAGAVNEAASMFERTKMMHGTWANYAWAWMLRDGRPRQDWSAEFHRDALHRVETSEWRIVADCAAQTGTMMNIATGELMTGAQVAAAACGIQSNSPVEAMEALGRRDGRFGPVDLLKIVDSENERFYAIDANGVIVASEIFQRTGGAGFCLQAESVAVEPALPEGDIFSEASLSRSAVPVRFRTAPANPRRDLWPSQRRCG